MMRGPTFRLLGVPIRIEIWFVITIFFLGLRQAEHRDLPVLWLLEWFAVASVSILVHEFGHAFAYRRYGQRPAIVLWGLGGLTYGEEVLSPRRSILVSLAGPAAGIILMGLPAYLVRNAQAPYYSNITLYFVLTDIVFLTLVWGLVNLLPLLPLDGGHITESVLEIVYHEQRRQTARMISVVTGTLFGLFSIIYWHDSYGMLFGWILAGVNLIGYIQVRRGSFGSMQFDITPQRPDSSDIGAGRPANVVSLDKARRKRDRRSPSELIKAGYEALERRDYKGALRITDRVQTKRLNAELDRWVREMAAFAWVGEHNAVMATEVLSELPNGTSTSRPLAAVVALANKEPDAGVELMVATMVTDPEGGPKLIAVDLFAEYGMIHRLARELVDLDGGSGFEAAVALEGMLHRLHRTQDASTVSDVIMLG
jgi:stage IV sporulation protein FB